MKKIILGLFVLVSLVFSSPELVSACSCAPSDSPQESLEKVDAVFVGKVVNIEQKESSLDKIGLGGDPDSVEVQMSATKAWKGVNQKSIKLTTPQSSASCGFNFEKDKEYIVYAKNREGSLNVSLCSRTSLVENAKEDLEELGKSESIKKIGDSSSGVPTRSVLVVGIISGVVGLTFMVIILLFIFTNKNKEE